MRYRYILISLLLIGCGSETTIKRTDTKIIEKKEVKQPLSPKIKNEKLSPPSIPSI